MSSLRALHLCARISRQRPLVRPVVRPQFLYATTHQLRMASNSPAPRFAEGEDPQQLGSDTAALQQAGWTLDNDGMGVTKTYHFKSYFKAVSFVNLIASESAAKRHHPTMTVRFGSVDVHWTTHNPRGLTHKDIAMAQHCDNGAGVMGCVDAGQGLKCGPAA